MLPPPDGANPLVGRPALLRARSVCVEEAAVVFEDVRGERVKSVALLVRGLSTECADLIVGKVREQMEQCRSTATVSAGAHGNPAARRAPPQARVPPFSLTTEPIRPPVTRSELRAFDGRSAGPQRSWDTGRPPRME
jgi:hypothetical protein